MFRTEEVWVGVHTPGTEVPERLEAIRAALSEAGHPFVPATAHADGPVLAVHDAALLDYLADAYAGWVAARLPRRPGAGPGGRPTSPDRGLLRASAAYTRRRTRGRQAASATTR